MNKNTEYRSEYGHAIEEFISSVVNASKTSLEKRENYSSKALLFDDFLLPGNYVLLGGDPGIGKTFLVYDFIKELFGKQMKSVALFSMASTKHQVLSELTGHFVGIEPTKLSTGLLEVYEWDFLDKRICNYLASPIASSNLRNLFIDTTPFMTLEHFEESLKDFVSKGCQYVFIDFIQLMDVTGITFPNLYEKMTYISHYLKQLAKYYNIPIVVICQRNRQNNDNAFYREVRDFSLSDFRDTGAFDEDADVVLTVDRPEVRHVYQDCFGRDLHDVMKVIILKDRNSHPIGEIMLHYDYDMMEFETYHEFLQGHRDNEELVPSKINEMKDNGHETTEE